jgi:hypothetical protein
MRIFYAKQQLCSSNSASENTCHLLKGYDNLEAEGVKTTTQGPKLIGAVR